MKFLILLAGLLAVNASASSDSVIVLKYDPFTKRALIKMGLLEANQFTGNNLVLSDSTRIEATRMIDEENTPEEICFSGEAKAVAAILERVVYNTDGNGDYWVSKVKVTYTKSAVKGSFTLTGEGGPEKHTVSISSCKY